MKHIIPLICIIALLSSCCWRSTPEIIEYLGDDTTTVECGITSWLGDKDKALVFTWDDNMKGARTVADVFNEHDKQTTFFVNTAAFDNWKFTVRHPLRKRMFGQILEEGHEIGSHTRNHKVLTKISAEEIESEMKSSKQDIYRLLGVVPTTMSYPTSKYNETVDSLMHLYYLDSRYSMDMDKDSTIRYMQVRTVYNFDYYKEQLDAFFVSNATRYVFGGHQLTDQRGGGYEPMPREVLDSILTYVEDKYDESCWVTTFENMIMYAALRDNVRYGNSQGMITFNLGSMKEMLEKYPHPAAWITLCFQDENVDFASDGLVDYWYDDGHSYCLVDLRKTTSLRYSRISKDVEVQKAMRNE